MTRKSRRKRLKEFRQTRARAASRRAPPWVVMGAVVASTALIRGTAVPVYARELDRERPSLEAECHHMWIRPIAAGTGSLDPFLAWSRDVAFQGAPGPAPGSSGVASSPATERFDIPPGPLGTVLRAFEQATRLHIFVPTEAVWLIDSPGVSGVYGIDQALQQLLTGTSLTYRVTAPDAVTLLFRTAAESVEVTGRLSEIVSPKYVEPLVDTPQSIDVVPSEVLAQQGATTLRDALRNVAGLSLAAGESGAQGDNLTIRGFTARNDLFIDGMRDFGSYYRDPFNTEEVEVLQGPSSVTFGRGSTGGVVNQASKSPTLAPAVSGAVDVGTDLTRRVTLDLNQPVPVFGTSSAWRLNVMADEGNVAGRDVAENRRFGVAPSLALGLGTATRWTLSYFHQTASDIPDYGVPWLFNRPAPVKHDNYYGFAQGNYLRTNDDIGTVKVEHDVNSRVSVRDQVRYANYARAALITEPQLAGPSITPSTPLGAMLATRHEIGVSSVETFLDEQLDVTARFKTGPVRHTVITGVEASRETSDPTRPTDTKVPSTGLLDPDPAQPFAATTVITSKVRTTARSLAAYALDTVALGDRWDLTGGVRWDRFDSDYAQFVPPTSAFTRLDQLATWRAAIVFKPALLGSVYADAGTSFNPSAESLSLSASTASLPPEHNVTEEVGSKWELGHRAVSLRAALFRTDKTNAREPDPNNALLDVLAGHQRVQGLELDVRGRLTSRWDLLSSYACLDGRVVSSQYYPGAVGFPLANVPRNTFNTWSTYRFPWRWEAGVGTNYVASRTASSTVPLDPTTGLLKQVPGYWTFSAMTRRPLSHHLDLQLNVTNLTNAYYYDGLHPGHLILGPGRSALLGLTLKR